MRRKGSEQSAPRVSSALEFMVQSRAQLLETASDALARSFGPATLSPGNFRGRQLLEMAQHDRGAIRFVECEHGFDQLALQLDAFDGSICGGHELRA